MATTSFSESSREMLKFSLHESVLRRGLRLGQLAVKNKSAIETPNFIVPTSRGVIPHVASDNLQHLPGIKAAYFGLEDFIERKSENAPIRNVPAADGLRGSKLRDFVALPDHVLSVIGPRRAPPLQCPSQNTNSSIAISSNVGFGQLSVEDYNAMEQDLKSDMSVSILDLVQAPTVSQKRKERMADRTHAWLRDTIAARQTSSESQTPLFASILPLEPEQQSFYLADICDEYKDDISGIALYMPETATVLPGTLQALPRMTLCELSTPHDILRALSLGNDLLVLSMITEASESGIAFAFNFQVTNVEQDQPLGYDLWSTQHATDTSPLVEGCECYTCRRHHRAYLQHLLSAKEMLAWTLLQMHNLHIMDKFFGAVRASIEASTFEHDVQTFSRVYSAAMPEVTGQGPRIRGYQTKSMGRGEPKLNAKAYGRLDEHAMKLQEAESGLATPDVDSESLEKHGLAEKTT